MLTFTHTVWHAIEKGSYKTDIVCIAFQQDGMPEALHSIW